MIKPQFGNISNPPEQSKCVRTDFVCPFRDTVITTGKLVMIYFISHRIAQQVCELLHDSV